MKKKLFKSICTIGIAIILLFQNANMANAAEFSQFSVKAVLPKNQIDKSLSYFDLKVKPGQKQTIRLLLTNSSKTETVKANISFNTAYTNRTGLIAYNNGPYRKDETLKYSVSEFINIKNPTPTLTPSSSLYIDVDVTMPNNDFQGTLLGGFVVTMNSPTSPQEGSDDNNGIALENRFAYTVGLKLRQNTEEVKPDFHLKSISPQLVNYRTSVVANLQNSEALITKDMKISAWVYKKNSDTVLKEAHQENAEMAPNSNFDFTIDWNRQKLVPGAYRLKMKVEYSGEVWEFDQDFTIENVDSMNNEANTITVIPLWVYVVGGFFLMGCIAFLFFLLGKKRAKKEQEK